MKKTLFLLSTIIVAAASTYAQGNNEKYTRMAFVLSPQISWLSSDHQNVSSSGSQFGYNFGLVIDRFFAPNYAITTGLTINTTGGVLKYADPTPGKIEYRLKYIEVPLAVKLKSNDANRLVFNGQFGVSNQFNVKATDADGHKLNDDVRFMSFGYHIGGGIEYGLGGSTSMMFGLLYHNGLTDVTKASGYGDKSVLNRLVFQIGVIF
ncbi:MAG: porin family protein [Breznakibacter sp.]